MKDISFKNEENSYLDGVKSNFSNMVKSIGKMLPISRRFYELKAEMDLLFSCSSDTVYKLRYNDMTYDYISPNIVRLLGYSPEEMKKINIRSLIQETRIIHGGSRKFISISDLEKNRKNNKIEQWQADYLIRTKSGKNIWVNDSSYPWIQGNKLVGSIGSLRDISERVDSEEKIREDLSKLANTDSLTGLSNRREFFSVIEKEILRLKRSNSELSILLIDIDFFKKINDTMGHFIGDKLLIEVSKTILSCLRETDLCARIGGEEFGIFLPDTPEEGAYWVAERICSKIKRTEYLIEEHNVSCTVSIGVASTVNEEKSSQELYKIADTRLYIAKNTGRNRVSCDEINK